MRTEIMLKGVFMSFHTSHDGIAAPDVPNFRMVFFCFGITHSIRKLFRLEFFKHIVIYRLIGLCTILLSLFTQFQCIFIELRIEGHPTHTHGLKNSISCVLPGPFILWNGIVFWELAVIAILACIDVVPEWCLLKARSTLPVFAKGDSSPGIHGG